MSTSDTLITYNLFNQSITPLFVAHQIIDRWAGGPSAHMGHMRTNSKYGLNDWITEHFGPRLHLYLAAHLWLAPRRMLIPVVIGFISATRHINYYEGKLTTITFMKTYNTTFFSMWNIWQKWQRDPGDFFQRISKLGDLAVSQDSPYLQCLLLFPLCPNLFQPSDHPQSLFG